LPVVSRQGTQGKFCCDWGNLSEQDKRENEFSVDKGLRIFSAYYLKDETRIWIITEAD
jgi:hypothetical protein